MKDAHLLFAQISETIDREQLASIFGILFWAFLVAALIWLVIWLLLGSGDSDTATAAPVAKTTAPVEKPAPAPTPAAEVAAPQGLPTIDTATSGEAAAAFSSELASGKVRQEDVMGILYNSAPSDVDDLKLIKGVAKVLEAKLHEFDVFTFKQIAFWTDDAAREFGAKLSFRDRIFRDDWIAQAKTFHEEKYGEKL